jgi:hypothetical protein
LIKRRDARRVAAQEQAKEKELDTANQNEYTTGDVDEETEEGVDR